jgi:Flp pilus assembly protein TadG
MKRIDLPKAQASSRRSSGQALVEFSLAVTIFLVLMMGVVDFGSAVYSYNGVSEAAREIARVASVHPGPNPTLKTGWSTPMTNVVSTQKALIPGLNDPTIVCVKVDGTAAASCASGSYVKVTITAPYTPHTPLLGLTGTWTMQGTSSVLLQVSPPTP